MIHSVKMGIEILYPATIAVAKSSVQQKLRYINQPRTEEWFVNGSG